MAFCYIFSFFFSPYVPDEPKSLAFGSIIDGIFDGKIHSQDGVFYVEKAAKYFPDNATTNSSGGRFHSIIYKEAHVIDPYEQQRSGTPHVNLKVNLLIRSCDDFLNN